MMRPLKMGEVNLLWHYAPDENVIATLHIVDRLISVVESPNAFSIGFVDSANRWKLSDQQKSRFRSIVPLCCDLAPKLEVSVEDPIVVARRLPSKAVGPHAVRFSLSEPKYFSRTSRMNAGPSMPSSSSSTSSNMALVRNSSGSASLSSSRRRCTRYMAITSAFGQTPASSLPFRNASSSGLNLNSTFLFYATAGAQP